MARHYYLLLFWAWLAPVGVHAQAVDEAGIGEAVERHLSDDRPMMEWVHDPQLLDTQAGDRLEEREVLAEDVETVKLTNVLPPIRFESGVADIPPEYIEQLRDILDGMR